MKSALLSMTSHLASSMTQTTYKKKAIPATPLTPSFPMTDPWYKDGLPFSCTGCGQCCSCAPGYVWVSKAEIELIAKYLDISVETFMKTYVRKVGNRYSLLEMAKTYDCVLLKENRCQIYSIRPKQCRTWPWWPQNIASKEAWNRIAKRCPGINNHAPIVSCNNIQTILDGSVTTSRHLPDIRNNCDGDDEDN